MDFSPLIKPTPRPVQAPAQTPEPAHTPAPQIPKIKVAEVHELQYASQMPNSYEALMAAGPGSQKTYPTLKGYDVHRLLGDGSVEIDRYGIGGKYLSSDVYVLPEESGSDFN